MLRRLFSDPGKDKPQNEGDGIYLGRAYDKKKNEVGQEIPYLGERHILLFGPNGTGKGTRFLVPNLLASRNRSIVVIDPKAELAAITAQHRHQQGNDVKVLDPFGVLRAITAVQPDVYRYLIQHDLVNDAGFNPLLGLDPDAPTFYDDAAAIGEALIKSEGNDPHWAESAQGLIVALIMWEKIRRGDAAHLSNVRIMLTEADEWADEAGRDGKPFKRQIAGLRVTAADMVMDGCPEIESLAGRFIDDSKEIASIRSTADTQTRWLLSRPMRQSLMKKDSIDFRQLKRKPTTVYVILPAERIRTHSVWLRLVIVSALRALYQPGGCRTMLFLDEMAALGYLGPLEDAFGLVRGYRVQIAGILQDLGQLKALYKERWETFIANAGVVMGFGPNDLTTAEWMSKRSGVQTVIAAGYSENESTPGMFRQGDSISAGKSLNQVQRPLFLPQDLIGLDEGFLLLWLAGLANPSIVFAPSYWKIRKCAEQALPNPYFQPGG